MSTDWQVLCDDCKQSTHLGQRFSCGPCFGFGSDDANGRLFAAEFISEHLGHCLRIVDIDGIPENYEDARCVAMGERLGYIPIDIPRSPLQDFAEECGKLLAPDEYVEAGTIVETMNSSVGEFPATKHVLVFGVKPETVVMIGSCTSDELEKMSPRTWVDGFHGERDKRVVLPLAGPWVWPGFFVRYTYGGQPGWVNNVCWYPSVTK